MSERLRNILGSSGFFALPMINFFKNFSIRGIINYTKRRGETVSISPL
jgi:hypothetical protein